MTRRREAGDEAGHDGHSYSNFQIARHGDPPAAYNASASRPGRESPVPHGNPQKRLVPWNDTAVDFALSPIHPTAGQLVAGLERPDVLLAVAGGLRSKRPHDLCAVPPVTGPVSHAGFGAPEATRRTVRMVAFIPGVPDQDQLATDVAGRKLSVAAATIVECFPGGGRKTPPAGCVDGHGSFHRDI